MKSRLFVVDKNSLDKTINNKEASIYIPQLSGEQWVKTIADIMADMLQIEIGDYIFLWEVKSKENKSRIHGVYRAISKPYFDYKDKKAPFKIKIEEAYTFEKPVMEYDVLNCPYKKIDLWTIIGKKVAGKSRGTTPFSLQEASYLITLLIGENPEYTFIPWNNNRIVEVENEIKIEYKYKGINENINTSENLDMDKISFFDKSMDVLYEKVLETIFNQEMSNRNQDFFSQLGVDVNKVIWFSNYLPYSIEKSEMDYVIIESEDNQNISKIYVMEFMKDMLDEEHIKRCTMYSKWVNETLGVGTSIVKPIIICKESYEFIINPEDKYKGNRLKAYNARLNTMCNESKSNNLKDVEVYTYDFTSQEPIFNKKR